MTEPNKDLITYRLRRAREALEEARLMADHGHANACVNRLYYACFYAVNALLESRGLSSARHSGVRSLFGQHFVKTGLAPTELAVLYNDLFEYRHESDYEDFFCLDSDLLPPWLDQVEQFIDFVAALLTVQGSE